MKRDEVYRAIDGEREFQDNLFPTVKGQNRKFTVGEELLLISQYLNEARTDWTSYDTDTKTLNSVRIIAALAVRCMENHGVTARP